MSTLLTGANIVLSDSVLRDGYVLFDQNGIIEVGESGGCPSGHERRDCNGLTVAPGFIDAHIHGCGGHDTMDGAKAVTAMSRLLPRGGTTSFLATTVASSPEDLQAALDGIRTAKRESERTTQGAAILGAHVEGPFLCAQYRGAHDESVLTNPDFAWISEWTDVIKTVTLAPELQDARRFITDCRDVGIICSIGHTSATYEQCVDALERGVRSFTHAYNAMSPLRHREPGAVGAMLTSIEAYAELICDNSHVHPAAQRVVFRAKSADRMLLITDALRPCMKGDGPFMLGKLSGELRDGQARLSDGTLAGSVLTMNLAVKNLIKNTGCALWEAVRCASQTPASLLGLERKGRVAPGYDADLVLLTADMTVESTYIGGQKVYGRGE